MYCLCHFALPPSSIKQTKSAQTSISLLLRVQQTKRNEVARLQQLGKDLRGVSLSEEIEIKDQLKYLTCVQVCFES